MLKTTTKYTFSSIIKPLNYAKTYYKYNGTSLNRKIYPRTKKRPVDNISGIETKEKTLNPDFIGNTDFPRIKVSKTDGVGRRFISPTLLKTTIGFHTPETTVTKYIVDIKTGETTPYSPLAILSINQQVHDYKEQTQKSLQGSEPLEIQEKKSYSMSSRTRSKIKQKLYAWTYAQKLGKRGQKGLTFVTLTFINHVPDKIAVKCLNNFLTWVRKNKQGFNYLWVAERQKNGRLHFHVICNKFFPVSYYNAYWVRVQNIMGINHISGNNLNPFDVRHIKQIKTLAKYITKYVTKNTTSFDCAVWNCSRSISALCTGYTSDNTYHDFITSNLPNYSTVYGTFPSLGQIQETDYATVIPIFNKKICESYKDVHAFNSKVLGTKDLSTVKELAQTLYNRPARPIDFTINHELIAHLLFEDLPQN
jgi:hypothetical protein